MPRMAAFPTAFGILINKMNCLLKVCVDLSMVDVGDSASSSTLIPARSGEQSEGNSVNTRDRHDTRCVKSNGHRSFKWSSFHRTYLGGVSSQGT